jgi:CheY-like chemotaxis protein
MSLKVLAIDRDLATLKMLRPLGTALGHLVLTTEDYDVGAQKGEGQRFDIVFLGLDVAQPEALLAARRIRDSQINRDTTLVVLSPADDVETLRLAFSEGADYVLPKPIAANRIRPMLAAIDSPGWKGKRPASRMPLFTPVKCVWGQQQAVLSSLNISESGMLLKPSLDLEVGDKVALEFAIAEVGGSLSALARIARKEETPSVAVEFTDLTPETRNAIQLYILGRLKEPERAKDLQGVRIRRWSDG